MKNGWTSSHAFCMRGYAVAAAISSSADSRKLKARGLSLLKADSRQLKARICSLTAESRIIIHEPKVTKGSTL